MKSQNKNLKLAIMTSGGDAPGMNTVISSLYKYAHKKYEMIFVRNAFYGLFHNDFVTFDEKFIRSIKHIGGTCLGSERFPQFSELSFQQQAMKNLVERGVDVLIVAGGNGSYQGAKCLSKLGMKVICIPQTIDNDVDSTDIAIGFPTALQDLHEYILKVATTSQSHSRIGLVEVMGRYCSDLSFFSAISSFSDLVITHENRLSLQEINNHLKRILEFKNTAMIVVSEKLYGNNCEMTLRELAQGIEEFTGKKVNTCVAGYMQRGGLPCAFDCILANLMSAHVIELIDKNEFNCAVSYRDGKVISTNIDTDVKKTSNVKFAKLINDFSL